MDNVSNLVCAGCAKPTTIVKLWCDDCVRLFAESLALMNGTVLCVSGWQEYTDEQVGHPVCMLCDAGMLRDAQGMHQTATGGHAGKCTAVAG